MRDHIFSFRQINYKQVYQEMHLYTADDLFKDLGCNLHDNLWLRIEAKFDVEFEESRGQK